MMQRNKTLGWITTAILAITLGLIMSIIYSLSNVGREIDKFIYAAGRKAIMSSVTTIHTDSEGVEHPVTTTRLEDETSKEWAARHLADLNAIKEIFP